MNEQRELQKELAENPGYEELKREFTYLCDKYVEQRLAGGSGVILSRSMPAAGSGTLGSGSRVTFKKEVNVPSTHNYQQYDQQQQNYTNRPHQQSVGQPR